VFCIVCTVFFVFFRLCIFILICFVCTSVRTTANRSKLNCNISNNNNTIEPNPVDYYMPEYVNIYQLQLRSEKLDDDDDNTIEPNPVDYYIPV